MFLKVLLLVIISILCSSPAFGQAITVFKGQPTVKISEGGVSRVPEQLSHAQAVNLACIISEIGGKYYWASREQRAAADGGRCIYHFCRQR